MGLFKDKYIKFYTSIIYAIHLFVEESVSIAGKFSKYAIKMIKFLIQKNISIMEKYLFHRLMIDTHVRKKN